MGIRLLKTKKNLKQTKKNTITFLSKIQLSKIYYLVNGYRNDVSIFTFFDFNR